MSDVTQRSLCIRVPKPVAHKPCTILTKHTDIFPFLILPQTSFNVSCVVMSNQGCCSNNDQTNHKVWVKSQAMVSAKEVHVDTLWVQCWWHCQLQQCCQHLMWHQFQFQNDMLCNRTEKSLRKAMVLKQGTCQIAMCNPCFVKKARNCMTMPTIHSVDGFQSKQNSSGDSALMLCVSNICPGCGTLGMKCNWGLHLMGHARTMCITVSVQQLT